MRTCLPRRFCLLSLWVVLLSACTASDREAGEGEIAAGDVSASGGEDDAGDDSLDAGPETDTHASDDDAEVDTGEVQDAADGSDSGVDASEDAVELVDVAPTDAEPDVDREDAGDAEPDGMLADSGADVAVDTVDVSSDALDAIDDPDVIPPECDLDGDGVPSIECGGDDCDDENGRVYPGARESCDFTDNDCDGEVNEEIDCRVYAHGVSRLYLVDPFLGAIEDIGAVPSLFDFDTDTDGNLYGISSSVFYRYDDTDASWDRVGTSSLAGVNGFAIDSEGTGYITGGNNLYTLDITTGTATLVGPMGGGFISSGDCVVDKTDTLFMTASGDSLVRIDGRTGASVLVGPTGFNGIWGLTAAYGYLFGFTSAGQVLEIDIETGAAVLRHTFSGTSFYGAASSATR